MSGRERDKLRGIGNGLKNFNFKFIGFILLVQIISTMLFFPACTMNNSSPTTINPTPSFTSSNAPATNPDEEPEEVEGRDPEELTLYPGSVRTAYILPLCECEPGVFNWYAVPANIEAVFNFYLAELENLGWQVTTEKAMAFTLYASKEGCEPIVIQCYESDKWSGFGSEIQIEWVPNEGYIGY
jgi:hypothetical protein